MNIYDFNNNNNNNNNDNNNKIKDSLQKNKNFIIVLCYALFKNLFSSGFNLF
jgi:hypothetical protein